MTATAVAAGVDTWSLAWKIEDDSVAWQALDAMATVPAARSRLLPEAIGGYRVGFFPGARLAFAEGHPFGADRLVPPRDLAAAVDDLHRRLADVGIVFDQRDAGGGRRTGFAGVRRLDLTVDLGFDRGRDGVAVLAGVAALPLPRVATGIHREAGGRAVETVYLRGYGGRRILGRWYDKGIEAGTAPRGELVRPEDQRRFTGRARVSVEALTVEAARGMFHARFVPLWKASEGVTVASVLTLAAKIAELRESGELTAREARNLAGYLVLEAAGEAQAPRSTRYRYEAIARRHGLVLADGTVDEVQVDLHAVLEEALEADDWYAEG